jgi:hypothetical protein
MDVLEGARVGDSGWDSWGEVFKLNAVSRDKGPYIKGRGVHKISPLFSLHTCSYALFFMLLLKLTGKRNTTTSYFSEV